MRTLLMFLLCAALTGCLSVDREPAFKELDIFTDRVSDNAINLWPLYLRDGETTSALWPIIKASPDHFAIRPIYNYDKGAHDLFLGIASADPVRAEYRLFPFFWHFPRRHFTLLLPLGYYSGPDSEGDTTAIGSPLLFNHSWNSKTGETRFFNFLTFYYNQGGSNIGLFPIYFRNHDRDTTATTLFPLYYQRATPDTFTAYTPLSGYISEEQRLTHWLFPLYYRHTRNDISTLITPLTGYLAEGGTTSHWLLPLYYRTTTPDKALTLTPLTGYTREGQTTSHWLLPLYYRASSPYFSTTITPLTGYTREDQTTSHWLLPLYYHQKTPDSSTTLTLFTGYSSKAEDSTHWLLPLYYHRSAPGFSSTITPLTGSILDGDERTRWLFPLCYRQTSPDSSITLTPLFGHTTEGDKSAHWLLPLYIRQTSPDSSATYTLLSGRTRSPQSSFDWLLPLYLAARDTTGELTSLWTPLFGFSDTCSWLTPLPIIGTNRLDDGRKSWFFPLVSTQYNHNTEFDRTNREFTFGLGLITWESKNWRTAYTYNRETKTSTSYTNLHSGNHFGIGFNLIYEHDNSGDSIHPGRNRIKDEALCGLLWNYNETPSKTSFSTLLSLYAHEATESTTKDNALWGLLWDYERRQTDSSFSILRYLYRHRSQADGATQTFIFPFIENRTGSDGSEASSFLWRLWRSERDAQGNRKHWFFFIPL